MADLLPDYVSDPNAILNDHDAVWRYGIPPDYSKTRREFEETRKHPHPTKSLPTLISNLIKNWEIEASFKPHLSDWRTIDPKSYTFSVNGGVPRSGEHMALVGTYNVLFEDFNGGSGNPYYCPARSGLEDSHKAFKRMMPTFAWEVVEVYAGPPRVAFRWRHWGIMAGDYVGVNGKGDKVTIKAHHGPIDIEGVAVASVNEKLQLQNVEIWFDPMAIFRQMRTEEDGTTAVERTGAEEAHESDDRGEGRGAGL